MAAEIRYKFQLMDLATNRAIIATGGVVTVTAAGDPLRATTLNKDGSALANPIALTRGGAEFYLDADVASVDLFIEAPGGQFVVVQDINQSELGEVFVDTNRLDQTMVIPCHFTNYPAATETDTGYNVGVNKIFQPFPFIDVFAADSGIVVDCGTDGTGSNDPDGFFDGLSLTSAVVVLPTLDDTVETLGALLKEVDSANAGDFVPEPHLDTVAGDAITVTPAASLDTGKWYVYLPYKLSIT